jgi:hypothetical protein
LALRRREKKTTHLFQEVEKEVVKARNFFCLSLLPPLANDKELGEKKTKEQSSPKEEAYGRK